jgi:hypothetical protein
MGRGGRGWGGSYDERVNKKEWDSWVEDRCSVRGAERKWNVMSSRE